MCRGRREADAAETSLDIAKGREVLPKNVKPLHYDLTLEPNFEAFQYEGTVSIELDVLEDTKSISLNTFALDVLETKVSSGSTVISSSPTLSYDDDSQTTKVSFDQTIPAGSKATLFHKFTGTLNDNMAGFYRSSYKDEKGNEKWMATTQFEPTDARRAFPAFDEPALKATFTVTLIADHHLTCLSNMDVAGEKDVESAMAGKKRKAVTFNKSPIMSTYLLAFIVGELQHYETNAFRLPVRVYATPDKNIEQCKFSAELAAKTLAFYEKEFGIAFPLPKMDMVAIPDFSAGAMENWGLVTYRVVDLLLDEKKASANTKLRVAEVVQHELAHQWFGNLVTMDFWDGLWLNEGFATWMSWYSCNHFFPEWKVWQGYVTDSLQSALGLDGLRSSHPIEVPVKRADEINQIFDAISYEKGSCVIRMVSKHLGEDVFMEGIRRYLKKHAYGNTETGDLWAALSDASGKDVERIADIWTKNVGYPVLSVQEDAANTAITVKQNRFLRTADVKPEEDKILYPVFLGLKTKEGVDESLTLNERQGTFKLPDLDFYKLNADHSGIYRTSYPPERLQKLGQNAKDGLLSVEDRAGMLADAGALTAAGYQETSGLLSLIREFDSEPEFVVWDEINARVGSVRAAWIFEDQKVRDGLKAFQRDLVSGKAHQLGWTFKDTDGHIEQQFKSLLFFSAASTGDEKTKKAAFDMFEKFVKGDRSAIHSNLRGGVYATVLQYGGEKEYNAILKEYETNPNADERNTALRSLGRAKQPELIKRTLAYALSKEVKDQDIYIPLAGLRSHQEGIIALWEWLKENWETLKKKLPPSLSMLGSVVGMATSSFTKEEQLKDVEAFFRKLGDKGFSRNLAQSMDSVKAKIGWLERDRGDIEKWLKENNTEAATQTSAMARYPTFEEYDKTGNYDEGIKRCDELLQRLPNDIQLLTTKLRLITTEHSDETEPLQEKLASLPFTDVAEICQVEQAVLDANQHTYPVPDSAGPHISKIWSNALKAVPNIREKMELLSVRWERAILDSRIRDMQETLIQFKSLQLKDRKLYMAHAALTQMLAKSNEDPMAGIALMLARKAVKEGFEGERGLDCRVPGQIFARQGAREDLAGLRGRRGLGDSRQVFEALREGEEGKGNGGEEAMPVAPDPSKVPPIEWLGGEVASLKHMFKDLVNADAEAGPIWTFAQNSIRLFKHSMTLTNVRRLPAEVCFLAISALIKIWSLTNNSSWLLHSACLAETLLKYNEHIHEARLVLIYLYMRLGLGSLAIKYFESLKVKEIQHDTIGHVLFTNLAYTHPHTTLLTKSESLDPGKRIKSALDMYTRCEDRLADCEAGVLHHGQTGMLFDLQELRDTLKRSLSRRIMLLEWRRIARLTKSSSEHSDALLQFGPLVVENWVDCKDTRDFHAAFDYGYNVERPLHGVEGGLTSEAYVLYALAADTVWSVAKEGVAPAAPTSALIERLAVVLAAPDSSTTHAFSAADHLATQLSLASLRLSTAYTDPESLSATIASANTAIDDLCIPALLASTNTFPSPDLLRTLYLYTDVLRNSIALCTFLHTRTSSPSAELTALHDRAQVELGQVQNCAWEMKARPRREVVEAWMQMSEGEVLAVMGEVEAGEGGLRAFLEVVAQAEVEGWDGVATLAYAYYGIIFDVAVCHITRDSLDESPTPLLFSIKLTPKNHAHPPPLTKKTQTTPALPPPSLQHPSPVSGGESRARQLRQLRGELGWQLGCFDGLVEC
ncbi:hypothetical protein EJ03DRAFT_385927 [Teratosphaeria nubilosa]|uniref:Uncharacterized protein n=1 Tax=Teratosphaeria nubilosa TaxID=161662 RepID=A0A6G1KWP0_9PEZI|nr:hypothetical protein EJ03DRAFT_385927 [Teratosphaeria nubilosa]